MGHRLVTDDLMDTDSHRNGCSKAMTHGAAPASATDGSISNIARGMGQNSVNPLNVTSRMGRGANLDTIGVSGHLGLEDGRAIGHQDDDGTLDESQVNGHRGTQRVPVYDAQGNLAGIRRVHIARALDN